MRIDTTTRRWDTARGGPRLLAGIALACLLLLVAADAFAQNLVYHSPLDNGVNPGVPYSLPVGPGDSLYLYLDANAASSGSGTPCNDGDGREICGYDVTVEALGSAFFVDFIAEPNVVYSLTPKKARINGLFSLNPAASTVRIGELKAASSDQDGSVMISGGRVVLAALQTESVPQQLVASVPEPAGALPVLAGVLALVALARVGVGRDARPMRR